MKNFMIGMHGKYDYKKFERDFRKEFYGVEACLFQTEEDINNLIYEAESMGFSYGIHFPLRGWTSKLRDPQFLSLDKLVKTNSYKAIEEELEFIKRKQLEPKYILFHFPKPAILKEDFDLAHWRFYDRSEYTYEMEYSFSQFKENSEYLFKWLSEKATEYNFIPVLEFDALNKYIYDNDYIDQLLKKYDKVKLCIDLGRSHLQNSIDLEFDDINIIKRFCKYSKVIHLWNVKSTTNVQCSHFPSLPTLRAEEGWAPIEKYLKIIKEENPMVKILFEHRSDLITDEELEICYQWINNIMHEQRALK